ncbi:hypothetical protein H4R20_003147 [Coemansia guatemalensis]|uniref:Uncharacterized protein n=1 Tax=Coemansia guatemalensis TaxID=2761395 RepID=A0A9W8LSX7_9FUNG|nr:hypothetical protein H4R20_003147 [Coemansia guatemalensis]
MEGPTIRDYIDARKKSGLSWEEFRALKEKGNENEFSSSAMADWRKQLDAEREAKLNRGVGRKARRKDAGRENGGSDKEHKHRHGKHRHHRRTHRNHSRDHQDGDRPHRTERHRGRSRSRSRSRSQDRGKRRHRRTSRSQSPVHSHGRKAASERVQISDAPNETCTEGGRRDKGPKSDV